MIISSYSGGSASAYEYSTFPELLSQLPDNSGNLIDAINVRNSVYTLWQRISQVAASQSATASVTYTNANRTPLKIGGIPAGSTFSNKTMTEMWDALLYPYIEPSATLTGGNTREFGSSNAVTLSWAATKGSKNVASIILCPSRPDEQSIALTTINSTGNQSGTKSSTATQNQVTPFSMTVTDIPNGGTSTITVTTTVSWSSAVYWGKSATLPPTMNTIGLNGGQPVWADGAGVGSGKILSASRSANYVGINGAGQYLVFAWPTAYGEPTFTVNGLENNAFTKVYTGAYLNGYGYSRSYDVWVTNTAQNSPISSLIIS